MWMRVLLTAGKLLARRDYAVLCFPLRALCTESNATPDTEVIDTIFDHNKYGGWATKPWFT